MPPNPGTTVYDGPGGKRTITIDTTTLANGAHRLFLRTDDTGSTEPPGVNSGVFVVPFTVAN